MKTMLMEKVAIDKKIGELYNPVRRMITNICDELGIDRKKFKKLLKSNSEIREFYNQELMKLENYE